MKQLWNFAAIGAAVIITGVAAYRWGGDAATIGLLPPSAAAREIAYYRNPTDPTDVSPVPKKDSMGMDFVPVYQGEEKLPAQAAVPSPEAKPERKILHYRNPMDPADTSPVPKKDAMGMDFVPVYEEAEHATHQAVVTPPEAKPGRKILYYRHPMGLPDVSPVPKKDAMGMDYQPVYEGEEGDDGLVRVSPGRMQLLGVRSEAVTRRPLIRQVRSVGVVQVNERRVTVVAPKFEGWIERLNANATGELVRAGQVLMEVYSPELLQVQQDYLAATGRLGLPASMGNGLAVAMPDLAKATLERLHYLDIAEKDLNGLVNAGEARRRLPLRAPVSGYVLEKKAWQGMRFMPGEMLYQIADLSSVWLILEVFEQDLAAVKVGQVAEVTVSAFPGRAFKGKVDFIYPTVAMETRTGQVRIEIPNPDGALRPGLSASVALRTPVSKAPSLAVPDTAVLDSGVRQVVLVARGSGQFEPRAVRLGQAGDGYVEVLEGLKEGEEVVVSANFLIDAESNLRAALSGLGAHVHGKESQ